MRVYIKPDANTVALNYEDMIATSVSVCDYYTDYSAYKSYGGKYYNDVPPAAQGSCDEISLSEGYVWFGKDAPTV